MTASAVISVARSQVGYREGYSGGHWNNDQKYSDEVPGLGWSDFEAWCATFVSWVAMKAGDADLYPRTASCGDGLRWFRSRGRTSEYPAIGAQVFYGVGGTYGNGGHHTGIVYAYDSTYIYTIEGNTNESGSSEGNGVYLKKRLRRDVYVYMYGYPKFPEGIVSADPRYGNQPSPPAQPQPPAVPAFPGSSAFVLNRSHPAVTLLDGALIRKGFTRHNDGNGYQPGPVFTEYTRRNVADFQRSRSELRGDPDGYPGPKTWQLLFS